MIHLCEPERPPKALAADAAHQPSSRCGASVVPVRASEPGARCRAGSRRFPGHEVDSILALPRKVTVAEVVWRVPRPWQDAPGRGDLRADVEAERRWRDRTLGAEENYDRPVEPARSDRVRHALSSLGRHASRPGAERIANRLVVEPASASPQRQPPGDDRVGLRRSSRPPSLPRSPTELDRMMCTGRSSAAVTEVALARRVAGSG